MKEDFDKPSPMAAWFLGPKAEHSNMWSDTINYIFQDYIYWRRNYFPEDKIIISRAKRREHEEWFDQLNNEIDKLINRLKAHYPFYSPRYIAHMLSEQTLPSVAGYFAGMLYNPNNVTDEAAPITVELELEAGKMISEMLGYDPQKSWAHITSGGTIANLEAIWVARSAQLMPLIIKEFCLKNNLNLNIDLPNGTSKNILETDDIQLLQMHPDTALMLPRKLAAHMIEDSENHESILEKINNHISNSHYNINQNSSASIYGSLGIENVIFISETAHYSFNKIAGALGLGAKNIRLIPVDQMFRMDTQKLKEALNNLQSNEIPLAVVGILGSTEEGAIDPVHEIIKIRDEYEKELNRSFWVHVDAAWGGYIRSLLKSDKEFLVKETVENDRAFESYFKKLDIEDKVSFFDSKINVTWDDKTLFKSVAFIKEGDSITIDPHKLGYIPYPAGIISFKNVLVTELISQKAQYISDDRGGLKGIDSLPEISAVGPYIFEGSKPGAAAASVFLAHKTIPLNRNGHGKIIKTTLLNTRKLYGFLLNHKKYFKEIEIEIFKKFIPEKTAFSFEPLFLPDSNLICYIMQVYKWENETLMREKIGLKDLNQLNEHIYKALSLSDVNNKHKMPYGQEYFISRTRFTHHQYGLNSISPLLGKLEIDPEEYKKEGLFVLRSTVMNPWYYTAFQNGEDHILGFVYALHKAAKKAIKELLF